MSEEKSADGLEPEVQGQEPESDSNGQEPEEKPNEGQEPAFTAEEIAQFKKIKRENANIRKDKKNLEAKLEALEAEKLTDQERQANELKDLKAEKTQWEATTRKNAIRDGVESIADQHKIGSARMAARLIDDSNVEFDGDKPTNLDDVLRELVTDYPELLTTVQTPQGTTNAGSGQTNSPKVALNEEELARATKADMPTDKWAEVKKTIDAKGTYTLADYERINNSGN